MWTVQDSAAPASELLDEGTLMSIFAETMLVVMKEKGLEPVSLWRGGLVLAQLLQSQQKVVQKAAFGVGGQ